MRTGLAYMDENDQMIILWPYTIINCESSTSSHWTLLKW